MKILLDTCVWGGVVQELRTAGHDVAWAGEQCDQLARQRCIGIIHLISLWETFVGSINYWFTLPQSNFSTNVPSLTSRPSQRLHFEVRLTWKRAI